MIYRNTMYVHVCYIKAEHTRIISPTITLFLDCLSIIQDSSGGKISFGRNLICLIMPYHIAYVSTARSMAIRLVRLL